MTRNGVGAMVTASVLSLVLLSGCAAASGSSGGAALTLGAVKSPLQLLRNEAANRVPKSAISSAGLTTDTAVPCKSAAEDPDEKYLSWESSALANIDYADSAHLTTLRSDLLQSFKEQGWTQGISDDPAAVRLKKTSSIATIDVSIKPRNEVTKIGGQLTITVTGPCVLTDGKDSPEVKKLEGGS